jgi:hypothetical protein
MFHRAHAASSTEASLPRRSRSQQAIVGNGTTVHVIELLSSDSRDSGRTTASRAAYLLSARPSPTIKVW